MAAKNSALAVLLLVALAGAVDLSVLIDRVAWPNNVIFTKDHPNYPQWKDAVVMPYIRQQTYISTVWAPAPSAVRNIVIIISGQQMDDNGAAACGTGQTYGWKVNWTLPSSRVMNISTPSIAGNILSGKTPLTSADTFFALAYDARFNWEFTALDKVAIENAYTNWIVSKATAPQKVFLVGASRGGALAARLARTLRSKAGWATVPIYAALVDSVPNNFEYELRSDVLEFVYNPVNSSKWAHPADLEKFYKGVQPPVIRHVITGAAVMFDFLAHAFCHDDISWYTQTWVDLTHYQICRCQHTDVGPFDPTFYQTGWGTVYDWMVTKM